MSTRIPRIALIDDHPVVCDGFVSRINEWGKSQVVLVAHSASEYFNNAAIHAPIDIAIVDRIMPGQDGFAVLEWIRTNQPETKAIMMSFDFEKGDVRRAMSLGARAALHKNKIMKDVLHVVETVIQTGFYMDEFMQNQLVVDDKPTAPDNSKILASLTPQETAVLQHICDPDTPTYKEIGERLGIKESTVHTYRKRLFEKFGISSKVGLFKFTKDWKLFKN